MAILKRYFTRHIFCISHQKLRKIHWHACWNASKLMWGKIPLLITAFHTHVLLLLFNIFSILWSNAKKQVKWIQTWKSILEWQNQDSITTSYHISPISYKIFQAKEKFYYNESSPCQQGCLLLGFRNHGVFRCYNIFIFIERPSPMDKLCMFQNESSMCVSE